MKQEMKFRNQVGEMLVATMVFPDRINDHIPMTIIVHGFGSNRHSETNKRLIQALIPKGIAVFALDLSGHGESEGEIADQTLSKGKSEIASAFEAVREIDWVDKTRIALVGSSFGGNAALLYAATDSQVRVIALKSPVTNYPETRELELGEKKIQRWREQGYIELLSGRLSKYEFYEDAKRIDTYAMIQQIKAPILVVQGNRDATIPMKHVERLKEVLHFPKDQLEIIEEADHTYTRANDFNKVISLMSNFLLKHLLFD